MDPLAEINLDLHQFLAGLDFDWRRRHAESGDAVASADAFVKDWRPHVQDRLDAAFARLTAAADQADPAALARASAAHRILVQPYFLSSRFCRRSIDKPLGYAGDFGVVEMIYRGDDASEAPLGRLLGGYCLASGPCDAHRGRLPWTHARLAEVAVPRPRLLSFACGPEVVLRRWIEAGRVADIVLADHDPGALAHASRELRKVVKRTGNTSTITTVTVNARDILEDPTSLSRLGGPFDAAMVLGLLDYLPDEVVVRFLRSLAGALVPGGAMLTSNLTGPNPWRAMMELTADWNVAHRSVAGFETLVAATGVLASVRTDVHTSGVNLYNAAARL